MATRLTVPAALEKAMAEFQKIANIPVSDYNSQKNTLKAMKAELDSEGRAQKILETLDWLVQGAGAVTSGVAAVRYYRSLGKFYKY